MVVNVESWEMTPGPKSLVKRGSEKKTRRNPDKMAGDAGAWPDN